jgi:RimJ/RimL family protein N-acetyltransferase
MIQGTKTRLRALEHDDLQHFVDWVKDPDLRRNLAVRYPVSMTEEEGWFQRLTQRENDYVLAIETKEGTYIGNIGLHSMEPENRQAMLGIAIGERAYQGQGYGTDAIRALLGWAFGYLNLNRVYLRVYAYNERAIRCYRKCGFQHEGTLRQSHYSDGQYFDELMMGILRDEFARDTFARSQGESGTTEGIER